MIGNTSWWSGWTMIISFVMVRVAGFRHPCRGSLPSLLVGARRGCLGARSSSRFSFHRSKVPLMSSDVEDFVNSKWHQRPQVHS